MKYQPLLRVFKDGSYGPRVNLSLDAGNYYVLSFTDFGIHLFDTGKPRGVALSDNGRARVFKGDTTHYQYAPVWSEVEFRGLFIQARLCDDKTVEITTAYSAGSSPAYFVIHVAPGGISRYETVSDAKKLLWPTDDRGRLLVLRGDHDFSG